MSKNEHLQTDAIDAANLAARKVQSVKGTKGDEAREARIKAALKANIARRKAQARSRETQGSNDE